MPHIRPAAIRDLPELAELARQEAEEQERFGGFQLRGEADWLPYVQARLDRHDRLLLVAEKHGALVGFIDGRVIGQPPARRLPRLLGRWMGAAGEQRRLVQPSRYGFIEDIYVVPRARRLGVASSLLQSCFRWFADRGIDEVEAAIWAGNEASEALFRQLGFTMVRVLVRRRLPAGA